MPIYSLERTLRAYGGPSSVSRLVRAAGRPFSGPAAAKMTAPTAGAKALRAAIRRADKAATASTEPITAGNGTPLPPNRWPDGCRG